MIWRRLVVAGALVAPAVISLPSTAATCRTLPRDTTHGAVVRVCQQQAWMHAPSGPAGRAGNLVAGQWNGARPTASLTGGGGAAAVAHPEGVPVTFSGRVTGPVDNVAFDLYVMLPARLAEVARFTADTVAPTALHSGVDLPARARLDVDRRSFGDDVELWLYRVPDVTGRALFKAKLAFTGLYPRTGPERTQHRLLLQLVPDELKHDESVFFYDATEVPSSVTVNATNLAGYSRVAVR